MADQRHTKEYIQSIDDQIAINKAKTEMDWIEEAANCKTHEVDLKETLQAVCRYILNNKKEK